MHQGELHFKGGAEVIQCAWEEEGGKGWGFSFLVGSTSHPLTNFLSLLSLLSGASVQASKGAVISRAQSNKPNVSSDPPSMHGLPLHPPV